MIELLKLTAQAAFVVWLVGVVGFNLMIIGLMALVRPPAWRKWPFWFALSTMWPLILILALFASAQIGKEVFRLVVNQNGRKSEPKSPSD